jgi:HK97 family phage portal protein
VIDLFRPVQLRSSLENPTTWLIDAFGGGGLSKAGARVNASTALEWVFDAVQVRSQTLAALPFKLFRQKSNGDRELAVKHPLYALAHDSPHPDLTSFEARNLLNSHLDLRGNAYAQIVRNNGGKIVRLVPLHPDRVRVKRARDYTADGLRPLIYEVTNAGLGGTKEFSSFDILHLRGFTTDGINGLSPLRIKAETLGLAIAANEHASRMFSNGARPAGVLEHPGKLDDNGRKNLRQSWDAIHGGVENVGKVAILEEAMKFHEVGLSNEDAQLLESRKYSRTEIASMYRVPPHMLGDLERATFSNIEQQSIEFVVHCMLPIVTNWEQRCNQSLLSESEQGEFFFRFNVAGLLRGDLQSRYNAYRVGLGRAGEPGWITVNDIREAEDMNRVADGDRLYSGITPTDTSKTARSLSPLLTDGLGRALRKEAKALRAIVRKPDAAREVDAFYVEHRRYVLEVLSPVCTCARTLGVALPSAESVAEKLIADSRSEILPALADPARVESSLVSWETTRAAAVAADILESIAA